MSGVLKLGPHYGVGGTGLTEWLRRRPTVVVYARDYPTGEPTEGVLVIGRAPDDEPGMEFDKDPISEARRLFAERLLPTIRANPHVPCWQTWNERHCNSDAEARWLGLHLAELVRLIAAQGKRAACGAWAVGTPRLEYWAEMVPMLRAVRETGAILTRHSYGDLNEYFAFRHRADNRAFAELGYPDLPVAITECGADDTRSGGGTFVGGWKLQYKYNWDAFWALWIVIVHRELLRDHYVIGAALFTLGGDGWPDFQIPASRLLSQLDQLLAQSVPAPYVPGIDVSKWQGVIDWRAVSMSGPFWAWIRISAGTEVDERAAVNWAQSMIGPLLRGPYHYVSPFEAWRPQADVFLRALGRNLGELRVLADIEASVANMTRPDYDPERYAEISFEWCRYVERETGARPAIYTGEWTWNYNLKPVGRYATWAKDYPLYVSTYPRGVNSWELAAANQRGPVVPKPWTDWDAWQFSASGRVPGIQGNVDLGLARGTLEQFWRKFGRGAAQAPAPLPPPTLPPPPPATYEWTHEVLLADLPIRVEPWVAAEPPVTLLAGAGTKLRVLERRGDWGRTVAGWVRLREGRNTRLRGGA